jgi:hypothetical protein
VDGHGDEPAIRTITREIASDAGTDDEITPR